MNTVARQFADALKEIGVKFVFGVPSGNMIDYIEAIRKTEGLEFILTAHESAAGFMAAVSGRLTGIPGACFGTFGPGATNLATGVGCGFLDRLPLLAFTDEMPASMRHRVTQMNINHQALFRPITKSTTRLKKRDVKQTIFEAAQKALSGFPGPVHIGVPGGLASAVVNEEVYWHLFREKLMNSEPANLLSRVPVIEKRFNAAKKPLIAVGLDAVRADAGMKIRQLSEKLNAPVVLTPMAKGILPESHPLYGGVLFHALQEIVAQTYAEADTIIGIGYDPVEVNYEQWMPRVPLIHIGENPADIDRKRIPEVLNLAGNIHSILDTLLTLHLSLSGWNLLEIGNRKKELFNRLEPAENTFGPKAVIAGLRKCLPPEGILTVDVGAHLHLVGQQWITPSPEKILMTNGWSSMGYAIPAAIAAKLHHPEFPVACLTGDGGFQMMAGELATAKRLNLPIVFIVVSDDNLSLISLKQKKKGFNQDYGTSLGVRVSTPANFYFGVPVLQVQTREEYHSALMDAFRQTGPVLIEAIVDGSEYEGLVLS
jgi:acetolactate synthase-1/2/3 large subunit